MRIASNKLNFGACFENALGTCVILMDNQYKMWYSLNDSDIINLAVYNLAGQIVEEPVNAYQQPGIYAITLNMHEIPSSIYFYKIQTDNFLAVKKIVKIE